MLESYLERKCCNHAKSLQALSIKVGQLGWPDRLFVTKEGKHIWVEFKIGKNKLSELQKVRIAELEAHNTPVHVVYDFETFVRLF